ncbi:NYN domain-containing protein [Candidatus Uhrbacteria bacterium]|nr:NYN domain-containing protein [Candidatus Uhrbacteria bacterium]MBD3284388.1 NYN domain-containing protein [Candidatus Uhrbacteria bacterium]
MIKRPDQRVVVLIDTQNMYHSAKHLYGAHLNFGKLVETLVGDRNLVRSIAYVATSKTGEEKGFFEALTASGIEVKSKDVIEFASGERKADWDVGIAVDAIKFSERVDSVILVTGDGDFVPLVEYLKSKSIYVEVAAFSESTSKLLRESVDIYFDISEHPAELLMVSGGRVRTSKKRVSDEGRTGNKSFDSDETEDQKTETKVSKGRRRPPTKSGGARKVRVTT